MKNQKYYLIGALILVITIIGYHYFAASQAEKQVDEAIQEQTKQLGTLSVEYSEINITPFTADVTIQDLVIIMGDHIERTPQIKLDLDYLDFLNIYFGGAEYGLRRLDQATIIAVSPSYTNIKGRQEVKTDTLALVYRGNALEGLRSAINGTPFKSNQSVDIEGNNITFSFPETVISKIQAQQLHYSGKITKNQTDFWKEGIHNVRLDSLTWSPTETFQNKYSFFIKGFGYETNAIPFNYTDLSIAPVNDSDTLAVESTLKSELGLLTVSGTLIPTSPFTNSQLEDTEISLSQFSEQFTNVLNNIEKLLNITLPKNDDSIDIQVTGRLSNPQIQQ